MALFGSSVDRAAASLRGLQESRRKLAKRGIELSAELASAREVSPDQILDELLAENQDAPRGDVRQRIVTLENQLEDIRTAQVALARRIQSGVASLFEARADALRPQLRKAEARLADHNSRTEKLLADLRAHTELAYQVVVDWPAASMTAAGFRPVERPEHIPPALHLTREVESLQAQIAAIEARGAQRSEGGMVTAGTLEQLLAQIAADAEQLQPFEEEVRAWHDIAKRAAHRDWRHRFEGFVPESDTITMLVLRWDVYGRISEAQSSASVAVRPYAPPIKPAVVVKSPAAA